MSENVDTAEEATEVTAVEESPIAQPQAAAQVQLPPNEDPGEMMMATIASELYSYNKSVIEMFRIWKIF